MSFEGAIALRDLQTQQALSPSHSFASKPGRRAISCAISFRDRTIRQQHLIPPPVRHYAALRAITAFGPVRFGALPYYQYQFQYEAFVAESRRQFVERRRGTLESPGKLNQLFGTTDIGGDLHGIPGRRSIKICNVPSRWRINWDLAD